MSDMSEYWRDVKAAGKEHREQNRADSPDLLRAAGIGFVVKNAGTHLIVSHGSHVVDFWPGTGLWIVRGGAKGRGVFKMINLLTS